MILKISSEDCGFLLKAIHFYTIELVNNRESCFAITNKKDKKSVEKFHNDLKKLGDREANLTDKINRLSGYSIKEKVSDE